jgi:hypothetical protein
VRERGRARDERPHPQIGPGALNPLRGLFVFRNRQTRAIARREADCDLENRPATGSLFFMADANPVTVVIAELLARLDHAGFEPFTIVMTDGSRHDVPSADHCSVSRLLRRITVEHDDGSIVFVNPLHIIKLESHRPAA